jgi:hypothetical protein
MHGYLLNIVLNHSITVAAIIAAVRFKTMEKHFRPYVFFIWLGFLNETLSLILIYTKGYNTVNSNIYVLFECVIILYQFYAWETIPAATYYVLVLLALAVWTTDNLVWHSLKSNNAIFRIAYSFLIVACSIKQLGRLAVSDRFMLLKNPGFLVCGAFLLFYTCKALTEVFILYHLQVSHACTREIFTVSYCSDCISNIIYAIAIVCIPAKQVFTMPY